MAGDPAGQLAGAGAHGRQYGGVRLGAGRVGHRERPRPGGRCGRTPPRPPRRSRCVTSPSSTACPRRRTSTSTRRSCRQRRRADRRAGRRTPPGPGTAPAPAPPAGAARIARPLAVRCAGSRTPTSVTSGGRPGARSSTTYSTSRPCSTARCAVCRTCVHQPGQHRPGQPGQRRLPEVRRAELERRHPEPVAPLLRQVHDEAAARPAPPAGGRSVERGRPSVPGDRGRRDRRPAGRASSRSTASACVAAGHARETVGRRRIPRRSRSWRSGRTCLGYQTHLPRRAGMRPARVGCPWRWIRCIPSTSDHRRRGRLRVGSGARRGPAGGRGGRRGGPGRRRRPARPTTRWRRSAQARAVVDALAADDSPHYGISTGFGALATRHIPRGPARPSCSAAWSARTPPAPAPEVEREVVRALMLLRLSHPGDRPHRRPAGDRATRTPRLLERRHHPGRARVRLARLLRRPRAAGALRAGADGRGRGPRRRRRLRPAAEALRRCRHRRRSSWPRRRAWR